MGEVVLIIIESPGRALPPGRTMLLEQLRVSCLPFPLVGKDAKTGTVA